MAFRKILLLIFLCVSLSGCSVAKHADKLLTLKSLAASQNKIEKSVALARERFGKMLEDYKEGSLKEGLRKRSIVSKYGEPVLAKEGDTEDIEEILLYRDPLKYMDSEKIYLYFNKKDRLVSLEYVPLEAE